MKAAKFLMIIFSIFLIPISCTKDEDNPVSPESEQFVSKTSPYLICGNRNPGGIGFDFEYHGEKGGVNYIDSLSVSDFDYDIKVRTIKAEKSDGTLCGMPFFKLAEGVTAVNYSEIDSTCTGYDSFVNLAVTNPEDIPFESDDTSYDLSVLTAGSSGKPLQQDVKNEFKKLVIADKWKPSANNDTEGDELVWLVKSKEGRHIKMIALDFPADPAPTATGYIAIDWEFID